MLMSEESSAAPQAQAVDPPADDDAHVPQPLHSEVISVTEREGLLYVGGYICFKLGE